MASQTATEYMGNVERLTVAILAAAQQYRWVLDLNQPSENVLALPSVAGSINVKPTFAQMEVAIRQARKRFANPEWTFLGDLKAMFNDELYRAARKLSEEIQGGFHLVPKFDDAVIDKPLMYSQLFPFPDEFLKPSSEYETMYADIGGES